MTIAARPTSYRGIEMRSRLEATVAANLDRWGYRWEYEPHAYADGRQQYLPDFAVFVGDNLRSIVEVKGAAVDIQEQLDRMQAVWATNPTVYLVLIIDEWIRDGAWRDAGWAKATVAVRVPESEMSFMGVYVLCECGTVGLRVQLPDRQLVLGCRGCGEQGRPIAFLDPTERL